MSELFACLLDYKKEGVEVLLPHQKQLPPCLVLPLFAPSVSNPPNRRARVRSLLPASVESETHSLLMCVWMGCLSFSFPSRGQDFSRAGRSGNFTDDAAPLSPPHPPPQTLHHDARTTTNIP